MANANPLHVGDHVTCEYGDLVLTGRISGFDTSGVHVATAPFELYGSVRNGVYLHGYQVRSIRLLKSEPAEVGTWQGHCFARADLAAELGGAS